MLHHPPAIEPDHHLAVPVESAVPLIDSPLNPLRPCSSLSYCTDSQAVTPPAFLVMPNWTVEETATYLRCEAQTIRKAISQKGAFHGLKPRRFGRRWYFSAADVRLALEAA
ncbi:helix-turn-helix domain-containing protein [Trinickia sp.]|uniref:helix-turn-helix domain-containing protein n=1 Tax=Trinickia sp. TaxID=2571163 RepID=UPI003F7F955B